jgi:hypothetical protein
MLLAVILGLLALGLVPRVPRIQPSTNAGARGWMDGRDKPDHDKSGQQARVL